MIGRHVTLEVELIEQRLLHHRPLAQSPRPPLPRRTEAGLHSASNDDFFNTIRPMLPSRRGRGAPNADAALASRDRTSAVSAEFASSRVGRSEQDDTTNRRSTTPRSGHLPIQPSWLRILEPLRANVNADQIAAPGVAVLLKLRRETSDIAVAREASAFGMSPAPLSASYAPPATAESGLLLGVTTTPGKNLSQTCDRLFEVIRRIDGRLETAPNKMLLGSDTR